VIDVGVLSTALSESFFLVTGMGVARICSRLAEPESGIGRTYSLFCSGSAEVLLVAVVGLIHAILD